MGNEQKLDMLAFDNAKLKHRNLNDWINKAKIQRCYSSSLLLSSFIQGHPQQKKHQMSVHLSKICGFFELLQHTKRRSKRQCYHSSPWRWRKGKSPGQWLHQEALLDLQTRAKNTNQRTHQRMGLLLQVKWLHAVRSRQNSFSWNCVVTRQWNGTSTQPSSSLLFQRNVQGFAAANKLSWEVWAVDPN